MQVSGPNDQLRAAINGLTTPTLMRLQLVARIFDRRRHEDLLQEAILRTLSGKRIWRDGIPIFWHLYGTMKSIASDWAKKHDENLVLESQFPQEGEYPSLLSTVAAPTPNPERQTIARLTVGAIAESCGPDPVVLALLEKKLIGKTETEIREELKLSHQDFSAAAQRLRRSARRAVLEESRYA
jgi:hypothetical protein